MGATNARYTNIHELEWPEKKNNHRTHKLEHNGEAVNLKLHINSTDAASKCACVALRKSQITGLLSRSFPFCLRELLMQAETKYQI